MTWNLVLVSSTNWLHDLRQATLLTWVCLLCTGTGLDLVIRFKGPFYAWHSTIPLLLKVCFSDQSRNAEGANLLSPTHRIQICIWPRSQSDLHAHWHLRNTVLQLLRKTQADLEHLFSKKLGEGWVCHRTWLNVTRSSWPVIRAREKCCRILLNSAAIHKISLKCLESSKFEVFR